MIYNIPEYKVTCIRDATVTSPTLDTPELVYTMWKETVETSAAYQEEKECLVVFLLNTRKKLKGFNIVGIGTLNQILTEPREVFRPAIIAAADSIILAHNHPSGDPTPSEADIRITRDLMRAGQILKIELLDHIIIGKTNEQPYTSLKELGYFYS